MHNPFLACSTDKNFIALKGLNKGYLQIAPAKFVNNFSDLNSNIFQIAHSWAQILEKLGAKKVYWITLSEALPHLHIHLFPRWEDQSIKGLDLFALREQCLWSWNQETNNCLYVWAKENQIEII